MNLSEIRYRQCECGKSFPLAHWIEKQDRYVMHNNELCSPCMRKYIQHILSRNRLLTDGERKRISEFRKMLPITKTKGV